jgi:hypothetical protein
MRHGWEQEWQELLRLRDDALQRSCRIRQEISDSIRRRQPPAMKLMRAADAAQGEIAAVRARLQDFLRESGIPSA